MEIFKCQIAYTTFITETYKMKILEHFKTTVRH